MALRILVQPDSAAKEVSHRFLLRQRRGGISQRTGSRRWLLRIGRTERLTHQLNSDQFVRELPCAPHRHFNLTKCLKDSSVVLAAQERRINSGRNKRMKVIFGEQIRHSI